MGLTKTASQVSVYTSARKINSLYCTQFYSIHQHSFRLSSLSLKMCMPLTLLIEFWQEWNWNTHTLKCPLHLSHFWWQNRHKHALCVLVLTFYICVCNSTPLCFLEKKEQKGSEDFWNCKELSFMKIWSGEDDMHFWWGRDVNTHEIIFKYSKYLVCV